MQDWRAGAGAVEAIVAARAADPFAILGQHATPAGIVVRAFVPDAESLTILDARGRRVAALERRHPAGFFEGLAPRRRNRFRYRLRAANAGGEWTFEDPFAFAPVLGDMDDYLFVEGRLERLADRFGAHAIEHEGVAGTHFAVWAPRARRVAVVGDFNRWDGRLHPLRKRIDSGVWEIFLPGVGAGANYKYEILPEGSDTPMLKADPLAFGAELRPMTASQVVPDRGWEWRDGAYMAARAAVDPRRAPMAIYEVHAGSWRRDGEGGFLSWDALAALLVPYARDLGFTHIQFLPVSEHPLDASWGYQPIGLFAPTRRFGDFDGLRRFVEAAHAEGLGVILDWAPAHFPTDLHGLARFDGAPLYEHGDPRRGFHPDWNTAIYDLGRREVVNFLEANAHFWLERFHIDGLRVDAVASMLYLDYSRKPGEWLPNPEGGNQNRESVAFLQRVNSSVYARHPGAVMIAEESTSWPGVSHPVDSGGLGFGFKWNMGWMNDTLAYMARDPVHRRWHHDQLTFGLLYAFSENFVLPLSHDEVVHGKGSLIGRMPGDRWRRFANLRACFGFMWAHPGKKLLFMGGEFAQEREWNFDAPLDWFLLDDPAHRGVRDLVGDLNRLYRTHPALHARDCEAEGFRWIVADDRDNSVYAFLRFGAPGDPPVACVVNFTPEPRPAYRIGLPRAGRWREILNSDAPAYGGSGLGNFGGVDAVAQPSHGFPASAEILAPPLSALYFLCESA